ncbi:MAG: GDP-mannose 4,6-dehydratase [Gemmataceae bacterium]|nr:GDP-mannose 4,6-dehydratase [Gemmataceae bacterium]
MQSRVLITGVTGFAGGHLAELLADSFEVHGTSRTGLFPEGLGHLASAVRLHSCHLTQPHAVEAVVRRVRPDVVYHLAGYARVAESFREPDRAWADNLTTTRSLYHAIDRWGGNPRVLFVSSGLVYGNDGACRADTPLLPASPYAASKAAADLLSYQVTRHPGLNVVRVRPFNQIGPRQCPDFAVARFARELARIEAGMCPPVLETGDLSSARDMTDIRDMVAAYRLIVEQGMPGEVFVAGTGTATTMKAIVDQLCRMIGCSVELRRRPDLHRPADPPISLADRSEIQMRTGWRPEYSLTRTLSDILDYWRKEIRRETSKSRAA